VRESVSQTLRMGRSEQSFGVISAGIPYWSWFAGTVGTCKWIHGDEDALVHGVTKPRFVDVKETGLKELLAKDPVDVALFDGCRPGVNSPVWAVPEIRCLIWFHSSTPRFVAPKGWVIESHALSHSMLGGVTNGAFLCRIARRIESPTLVWPVNPLAVTSFLHQVVDPTIGGPLSKLEPEYERRELNTASGHLNWKQRFGKVLVPTVYSKEKWATRRLHPKELLSALDVPADIQGKITTGIVHRFTEMPIPGKIRTHVLRVVLGERLEKKRRSSEEVERSGNKKPRSEPTQIADCLSSMDVETVAEEEDKPVAVEAVAKEEDKPVAESTARADRSAKAVKLDDAEIPMYLWDE
jgi:hypothetical protein